MLTATPTTGLRARKSFATYLDLLRFTASLLVVLEHAVLLGLLPPLGVVTKLSHEAVIVFFVLSGLVIGASSLSPTATLGAYVANRAARVYSVALPAIVCSFCAALVAGGAAASGATTAAFFSSLFFLNGVWFNFIDVPLNGPFWSLCYEVWYYAAWGALRFTRRIAVGLAVAGVLLLAMGPAFAALFGIWLAGAAIAARQSQLDHLVGAWPRRLTIAAFVLSAAGVIALGASSIQETTRQQVAALVYGWWRMRNAEYMVTDYVIGALVALHLVAASALFAQSRRLHDSRAGAIIRYCAGFTFTMYLFHYPLLLAARALLGAPAPGWITGLGSIAAALAGVWAIAFVTERQLPRWRRAFDQFRKSGARDAHGLLIPALNQNDGR